MYLQGWGSKALRVGGAAGWLVPRMFPKAERTLLPGHVLLIQESSSAGKIKSITSMFFLCKFLA